MKRLAACRRQLSWPFFFLARKQKQKNHDERRRIAALNSKQRTTAWILSIRTGFSWILLLRNSPHNTVRLHVCMPRSIHVMPRNSRTIQCNVITILLPTCNALTVRIQYISIDLSHSLQPHTYHRHAHTQGHQSIKFLEAPPHPCQVQLTPHRLISPLIAFFIYFTCLIS